MSLRKSRGEGDRRSKSYSTTLKQPRPCEVVAAVFDIALDTVARDAKFTKAADVLGEANPKLKATR